MPKETTAVAMLQCAIDGPQTPATAKTFVLEDARYSASADNGASGSAFHYLDGTCAKLLKAIDRVYPDDEAARQRDRDNLASYYAAASEAVVRNS